MYRSTAGVDKLCFCIAKNGELRMLFFTLQKGYNKEEYVAETIGGPKSLAYLLSGPS